MGTTLGGRGSLEITNEPAVRDSVIAANSADAWAAMPSVFDALGIDAATRDPRQLLIGTEGTRAGRIDGSRPSRFLDCGSTFGGPRADTYEVTLYLMVQLAADPGGGTLVRTVLDAYAEPREVSGNAVHCLSKGVLERRVMEVLGERLGA